MKLGPSRWLAVLIPVVILDANAQQSSPRPSVSETESFIFEFIKQCQRDEKKGIDTSTFVISESRIYFTDQDLENGSYCWSDRYGFDLKDMKFANGVGGEIFFACLDGRQCVERKSVENRCGSSRILGTKTDALTKVRIDCKRAPSVSRRLGNAFQNLIETYSGGDKKRTPF